MGTCSYCFGHAPSWEECSNWEQARGCAGITSPDDPERCRRAAQHYWRRAREAREEADRAEAEAKARVTSLRRTANDALRTAIHFEKTAKRGEV